MAISICTMEYEHLDEVSELEAKCFTTPWSRNAFKDAIDSANYDYIVALDDNKVVGYAGMQVVLDEAEITNIAVDEGMRGRHIATALIDELVNICHNKKVIYLHLEVRLSNTPARNLYEKCDFVIDGVRKNFYDKPKEDAILMTKTLEEV